MGKRLCLFLAVLFVSVGIAFAQTQVNGTVVSAEDGEPVVGASVIVTGTKTGTVTDVDGKFSLSVPTGGKITVNYIGMQPQTVVAKPNMKITMKAEAKALEEVIVTGYGNVKKSSFTGSAATMNTKGLEDVPVVSVEDKLAGGVSGVTITSKSSSPGGTSSIRIRGMGSINAGNDPLIVIDGTPVNSGNLSEFDYSSAGTNILSTINSNDIESMTVISAINILNVWCEKRSVESNVRSKVYIEFSFLAFLCRNHHNTIRCSRTIKGCGVSTFQDVHRFDVIWVNH